jgi:hypothetical protein
MRSPECLPVRILPYHLLWVPVDLRVFTVRFVSERCRNRKWRGSEMEKNEVNTAFEILLEEVEAVGNTLNDAGADAFRKGDYEQARRVIEDATRLAGFREKIKSLQKEWQQGFVGKTVAPVSGIPKAKRKIDKRLTRGLRTPEEAFRLPLLQALNELGGRASMNDVLNGLEKNLKSTLTPYDYQPLPSNPKQMRWKNTAQWCRLTLVTEGLMKNDSHWGVWEISPSGVKALKGGREKVSS